MPEDMEDNGADVSDPVSENEEDSETFLKDDDESMTDPAGANGSSHEKKKYDPKDPSRPRRKKARRACFACQRAHLTCGDERPCKRCIKRGLADACQDGVRKKAKYLHDAPPEALRPVLGPNFSPPLSTKTNGHSETVIAPAPSDGFLPQRTPSFSVYPNVSQPQVAIPENIHLNPQASPISPSFHSASAAAQAHIGGMLQGAPPMDFNALFDPSNPALYNFDLEGLNFGSQYAGWEFGILNKMTLGAETPPRENSISHTPKTEANYAAMFGNGNGSYDGTIISGEYGGLDIGSNMYTQGNLQHGLPHAFAIAAGPNSLASPSTDTTASPQAIMDGSPNPTAFTGLPTLPGPQRHKQKQDKMLQSILGKRQRDSASIYASVKEPYPYVAGFHNMISVIRNRLPLGKLLKIAQSLGEIRPSFISCTKDLTREDLIFMEKCFQRTLVEFDDFLQHCCAPTIVCRRSGEVAAVNKEFAALTGWPKDVLLGKAPNRNIYTRSTEDGTDDGESLASSGQVTPAAKNQPIQQNNNSRPQPVFLGELLDDDSLVEFYRDFAQLAFEDSRGKVQRSGRLIQYRTQEMLEAKEMLGPQKHPRTGILSSRVTMIDSEHGISRIEKDGKIDCTYCWTIKRDVFDIPMMIIINFLPRYHPNQEPHQLAV
ncbi:putative C6 finger domain protein [Trichoderma evansii]